MKSYLLNGQVIDRIHQYPLKINWIYILRLILYGILFLIPFQFYLNIGPSPLAIGYILILFLAVLFLPILAKRNWRIYSAKMLIPLIALWLVILLSLFRAKNLDEALVKILHLGLQTLLYFLVLNLLTTKSTLFTGYKIIIFSGVVSALFGLVFFVLINILNITEIADFLAHRISNILYGSRAATFFDDGGYYSWVRPIPGMNSINFRATALFVTSAENGLFSTCVFFLILAAERSFFKGRRILWIAMLTILVVNILIAQVRGVWVGLTVGLIFYVFQQRIFLKPKGLFFVSIVFLLFVGASTAFLGREDILVQAASIISRQDSSAASRLSTMESGLEIIFDHAYALGLGPGNVPAAMGLGSKSIGGTSHSMYLDIGISIGGLGLIIFLWLMMTSLFESRTVQGNTESRFLNDLALGYQYLWVSLMVIFIFQGNLFGNPKTNLLIWGLIGMISAAVNITKRHFRQRAQS